MPEILSNARIVTPEGIIEGALSIADGRITDIDSGPSAHGSTAKVIG
jgi:alpha-D-ribose 1-methylphosphonate 5-triphosphate diphosphatase PhnM